MKNEWSHLKCHYVPTMCVLNLHWVCIQLHDYIEKVWMLFTLHSVCTEWDLVNTQWEESDHSFHNIIKTGKNCIASFFAKKTKPTLKKDGLFKSWD